MSFDWNLSSEDDFEDDGDDEESRKESLFSFEKDSEDEDTKPAAVRPVASPLSGVASLPAATTYVHSDNDQDSIDWEDADDESMEEEDKKLAATATSASLQPVTIDLHSNEQEEASTSPKKKKNQRKGRKRYRFKSLPPSMQSFLLNLRQSHLLSLMSRAVLISQTCSDVELQHVAHSLIPMQFHETNNMDGDIPTMDQLQSFLSWYFDFVNRVEDRRRAAIQANLRAGAPSIRQGRKRNKRTPPTSNPQGHGTTSSVTLRHICSYLSQVHDEDPQVMLDDSCCVPCITDQEKAQLLVAMAR
jgi:hypothetical protein